MPVTPTDILVKLFEHNLWANREVIGACAALTDKQLDATPHAEAQWSIRKNLTHLLESEHGYLGFFTPRSAMDAKDASFANLDTFAQSSGKGFLAVIQDGGDKFTAPFTSSDGYRIEPWVAMVQAINHATEHRKQIVHLMRLQDLEPPRLDGWSFGEDRDAVTQPST